MRASHRGAPPPSRSRHGLRRALAGVAALALPLAAAAHGVADKSDLGGIPLMPFRFDVVGGAYGDPLAPAGMGPATMTAPMTQLQPIPETALQLYAMVQRYETLTTGRNTSAAALPPPAGPTTAAAASAKKGGGICGDPSMKPFEAAVYEVPKSWYYLASLAAEETRQKKKRSRGPSRKIETATVRLPSSLAEDPDWPVHMGAGTFGTVVRYTPPGNGPPLAVKLFRPPLGARQPTKFARTSHVFESIEELRHVGLLLQRAPRPDTNAPATDAAATAAAAAAAAADGRDRRSPTTAPTYCVSKYWNVPSGLVRMAHRAGEPLDFHETDSPRQVLREVASFLGAFPLLGLVTPEELRHVQDGVAVPPVLEDLRAVAAAGGRTSRLLAEELLDPLGPIGVWSPLAAGGDLGQYLRRLVRARDAVDPGLLDRWMYQLVEAVHALHRADTFHRDIKLSNVLLSHEATHGARDLVADPAAPTPVTTPAPIDLALTDWGFSCHIDECLERGVLGTMGFLDPRHMGSFSVDENNRVTPGPHPYPASPHVPGPTKLRQRHALVRHDVFAATRVLWGLIDGSHPLAVQTPLTDAERSEERLLERGRLPNDHTLSVVLSEYIDQTRPAATDAEKDQLYADMFTFFHNGMLGEWTTEEMRASRWYRAARVYVETS
ncbi:hypothetical protein CXG81DRAFT_24307 [Caulochytrium protostelioides]|uniref:non-specific serine/threonine protein kinase n=1 Tax=Caulochytrium protostelioides TaxID=1555241 RepID=A0A4P9XCG2_9FUNG|nr:hypothetical protein CXG81DRAFT_24307 [Caulochytrium protostelioides]|eukprot:RKP03102.1 hypothetical protein CXG81DRAFT_24307 [Caulochytrium protostelioides]